MERFSKNRQAILECLRSTTVHPTAEWVYKRLQPDHPNLSLGTVYRNLCQLKAAGVILSMGTVAGEEHFDGNTEPHAHVMCSCCGRIDDLEITPTLKAIADNVQSLTGFGSVTPQFAGLCPECRVAGATE